MKTVKLLTLILIIILISLISFGGLFLKTEYRLENVIPEYKLGRNLSASRIVEIGPDETVNKVIKDQDGNVVEAEGENTTTEDIPVNAQELLTKDNFEKTKKIIINRLEQMGVTDYNIRLNSENGKIILELENSKNTDIVSSYISQKGNFTITDDETEEVLMDSNDIKLVNVGAGPDQTGLTSNTEVYLNIQFNKEGAKKLEEISSFYISSVDQEGNATKKNVSINVDGQKLTTMSFEQKFTTGGIQLKVGSSSNDTEQLREYITSASNIAIILDNGELPITYVTNSDQYLSSNIIIENIMPYAIYIIIVAILAIFIVMLIRYKATGVLSAFSIIGFISVFLLVLRYTNIIITIEGILGIVFSTILNILLVKMLLKEIVSGKIVKEATKEAYKKYFIFILPVIIMSITFSFIKMAGIASLGMTLFWGITMMALYNFVITRAMLNIAKSK